MYEICWQEFKKNGEIVTKRKAFKTEQARTRFVEKLVDKNSFYQILAYTD